MGRGQKIWWPSVFERGNVVTSAYGGTGVCVSTRSESLEKPRGNVYQRKLICWFKQSLRVKSWNICFSFLQMLRWLQDVWRCKCLGTVSFTLFFDVVSPGSTLPVSPWPVVENQQDDNFFFFYYRLVYKL